MKREITTPKKALWLCGERGKKTLNQIEQELKRESILAMGRTAPNPAVACVILAGDEKDSLFFSGGTEKAGERHAEIVALDLYDEFRKENKALPLRMHVTLEPCSHSGKTAPCTDRIAQYHEIQRVNIYLKDQSLEKSGIDLLRNSGIKLEIVNKSGGVPVKLARAFLGGFLSRIKGEGPRFHFKAAFTQDHFMSAGENERLLISGLVARRFTMLLRAKMDAVLVGSGTTALDSPGLNFRATDLTPGKAPGASGVLTTKVSGEDIFTDSIFLYAEDIIERAAKENAYQPDRILTLGRYFQGFPDLYKKQLNIAELTGKSPIFITTEKYRYIWEKRIKLEAVLPELKSSEFSAELRGFLAEQGYNDVLIEGGATLFSSFENKLRNGDRIYLLKSKKKVIKEEQLRTGAKRIPGFMYRLPAKAEYDLDDDSLFVKEY